MDFCHMYCSLKNPVVIDGDGESSPELKIKDPALTLGSTTFCCANLR